MSNPTKGRGAKCISIAYYVPLFPATGKKLGDLVKLPSTPIPKMKEPDWDDEPYEDVLLSKDESTAIARVVRWVFGSNGEVIENWNANPILNTLVYKCEFDDGTIKEYVANVIASNIYEEGDAD